MNSFKLTRAEEDYILAVTRFKRPVRTSELARVLKITEPSVTSMVDRLSKKGLLKRKSHQPISLTQNGVKIASRLLRRHRLIEQFLFTQLKYEWHEVHEEAHQIEHNVTDKFINRLETLLSFPATDPHGSPIPDKNGETVQADLIRLSEFEVGDYGVISQVSDHDEELLKHLGESNLYPGVEVKLTAAAPFQGSLTLVVNGTPCQIGREAAHHVFITKENK